VWTVAVSGKKVADSKISGYVWTGPKPYDLVRETSWVILFDVSIVISHGQFLCGNKGHTQNTDFPWMKSHFPVGRRSSGTATIVSQNLSF